ncbi:MAG: urease accessory protein UreE [Gammaproteobacteria bacterium]|jgi:urease accessory protein|nr:urease accessory protein UreE [Gammaproteobacteria bacterium]
MHELTRRVDHGEASTTLTLPLEKRIRSRLRVTLDDGAEAGVFLERGQVLRDGDLLGSAEGLIVQVRAAAEPVSEVRCGDPLLLARACYHLGNRHMPLQIAEGLLRYQHDHVLDDMLLGLGLQPTLVEAPFEPEPGAYGGSAQGHGHAHAHSHDDAVH